ncbi:MAG: MBL fold metallo-hydrolase [Gemmatimonadota bacterium]
MAHRMSVRGLSSAIIASLLSSAALAAQTPMDTIHIVTIPVATGISMLQGSGGNIGVAVGEDGVFVIDDQFAPLTERIRAAIAALSDKPVRFIVNTHWHGDHTGGNENFGKLGTVIVAHDNVRKRMSVDQFMARFNNTVKASPKVALPILTFDDHVTFHLNGDDIHVVHVANAHTDGDAIIHWVNGNTIHMGDVFFNGMYPFIDDGSGGSIQGMIAGVDAAMHYVNDGTKIIPGHGPLATKADLVSYREMLAGIRDRVQKLISQKKNVEQAIAAKPTAAWDARWGNGFIKPDDFVKSVYAQLTAKK